MKVGLKGYVLVMKNKTGVRGVECVDVSTSALCVLQLIILSYFGNYPPPLSQVKHGEDPLKFIDSEVEVDDAIKAIAAIGEAPELYPQCVSLGLHKTLLGLLTHDNTDISISVLETLNELLDPEVVNADEEAEKLSDALVSCDGLELLVQNLARLKEVQEEDARGNVVNL